MNCIYFTKMLCTWRAVIVAQLLEQSFTTPEYRYSNTVISNCRILVDKLNLKAYF